MFISLDLETTGMDPSKDKIIEFGAVKFDLEGEKERLSFLANPGIALPQIITHITGITDKDLTQAPPFSEKIEEVKNFLGDLPIIGHNIEFDTGFLRKNGLGIPNPEYDTVKLASILLPGLQSYSLEILSHILKLEHVEKHRALDDSIAAMELFIKLAKEFSALPERIFKRITPLLHRTDWPLAKFLLTLKPSKTAPDSLIPPPRKKEQPPETALPKYYDSLLSTSTSGLFEYTPPYEGLVKKLISDAGKDSCIAVPHQLFMEIEAEISDSFAKIDSPSKYISLKRLEEFEASDVFLGHEISALLKYIIWLGHTKTGLLSEVALFNLEKETLSRINADKNFANPEEEQFFAAAIKKDESASALCTHDYLIENTPPVHDLTIIALDKFIKSLFYHSSLYVKLDILLRPLKLLQQIKPENAAIQSLTSKSTILFGLIGMIFEKFNDENPYGPRVTVTEFEIQSREWKSSVQSITSLIEVSKELGEIVDQKTLPHLKNWKSLLEILQNIFIKPDLDSSITWLEKDMMGEIAAKSVPVSLKPRMDEILKNCENYKILSENLDLSDDGLYAKNLIGLPQDLPLFPYDRENKDIDIYITQDDKGGDQSLVSNLVGFLKEKRGKTAIIFNSKASLQYFTLALAPQLKKLEIKTVSQLTGSSGKTLEKFRQDPDNSILLLTPNFWENFAGNELINTLIIHKIPFCPPGDAFLTAMSRNSGDPFNEFQIPQAISDLKKIINRLNPSEEISEVIILDSRLVTKSYGKDFIRELSTLSTPKIISASGLNSIVKQFHH
ncbi:MAG: exonuclease domain-containing protein [Candidatus Peregrinibacteria bacterium]